MEWLVAVVLIFIGYKIYYKFTTGKCRCKERMDGKTVIVTGSNTGIGKETALDLAKRGAKVILACRDPKRANEACDDIISATGNKNVIVRLVDFSSLESVRKFAQNIIDTEPRLDVLVNNAGAASLPHMKTDENLELVMQVNHFGPFLLTCLLLDLLKKSAPSRIIMVSSNLHRYCFLDWNNINSEKWFNSVQFYGLSKLGNVMTACELTRRIQGTGVTINSLHPGTVVTEVWRNVHHSIRDITIFVLKVFTKDCVEGAQTTIHLAVSKELEGLSGKYFSDCKEVLMSSTARNKENCRKFFELSEKCVGLKPEEKYYLRQHISRL